MLVTGYLGARSEHNMYIQDQYQLNCYIVWTRHDLTYLSDRTIKAKVKEEEEHIMI